jgi:hypothetical protein
MTYTKVFKRADGSIIYSLTLHDAVHPWTLRKVVWNNRRDFLDTAEAAVFEVLDSESKRIVKMTREELDANATQYKIDLVEVPEDRTAWLPTGKSAYTAAWSEPLAMALAKELVADYPPATGFDLFVHQDRKPWQPLQGWDRSHDAERR